MTEETGQATSPVPTPPPPPDPSLPRTSVVEAALFSAGRALSVEELRELTGLPLTEIRDALGELRTSYQDRETALDVIRSGEKWALGLRARYADRSRHLVPPEIPIHVLRTLALIAYHQPVLQSEIRDMVGAKVYEHVHTLVEAGLVTKRPDGVSFKLRTTESFPEYFGIEASDAVAIRRVLAERVGLADRLDAQAADDGAASDEADETSNEENGDELAQAAPNA